MSQPPTPIRSRWLVPVISGVVGAVCLLVVVLAYAAFVGTLTARKKPTRMPTVFRWNGHASSRRQICGTRRL